MVRLVLFCSLLAASALFALAGCSAEAPSVEVHPTTSRPSQVGQQIVGKWRLTEGFWAGSVAEFTPGGTLFLDLKGKYSDSPNRHNGRYSGKGNAIRVLSEYADEYDRGVTVELEFLSANELVMAVRNKEAHFGFEQLGGRWRRLGRAASEHASLASGDIEGQLHDLQERRRLLAETLEKRLKERLQLLARITDGGSRSLADITANSEWRIHARELQELVAEINTLTKQMAAFDQAIVRLKALAHRAERQDELTELGLTAEEMDRLNQTILEFDESARAGASRPVADLELQTFLEQQLLETR